MPALQPRPSETPQTRRENKTRQAPTGQSRAPAATRGRIESEHAAAQHDKVDIASMDSFPCSDPPGYAAIHC
jgi:hypothetical protein